MSRTLNVALIGQRFMGRAHSNAYRQAPCFFELPLSPSLHTIAARDGEALAGFAERWGWRNHTSEWRQLAQDPEIDLVDVATPNYLHRDQSIAMLEAGKHVACEKPLASNLDEARAMRDAASVATGRTFVWFNYRRCPAVALAHRLVKEGRLGRIYHLRGTYLQSWGGPETPRSWRFDKKQAGSGAHGDLNAHIVDMARFITGDDVVEIHGAVARTFVKERVHPESRKRETCDVDDCVLFLASFANGATASFEATRLATGHLNANSLEINGEKASLRFEFEQMNRLQYMDADGDPRLRGWRSIMCTSAGNHPYAEAWWPDAHIIGYEHGFTNMVADMMRVLADQQPEFPLPDFADAYETQRVLEAALISAESGKGVHLNEVR